MHKRPAERDDDGEANREGKRAAVDMSMSACLADIECKIEEIKRALKYNGIVVKTHLDAMRRAHKAELDFAEKLDRWLRDEHTPYGG